METSIPIQGNIVDILVGGFFPGRTISHDSHIIIAVGATDADRARAVNLLVEHRGGISEVHGDKADVLPLPHGGLMSADGAQAAAYQRPDAAAKNPGSPLTAPFMTLSFMALLVIPALKPSDKGLFDGTNFSFVPLFGTQPSGSPKQ